MEKWALIIFFMISMAWAKEPLSVDVLDKITVTAPVTLRSSSYFGRSRANYLGTLNPGTKAEIISTNTNLQKGIGILVRLTNGPFEGRVGWIYYHKNPKRRALTLENSQGVIVPEEQYPEDASSAAVSLFRDAFGQGKRIADAKNRGSNLWNQVALHPDYYSIDIENYDGGEIVPIKYRYVNVNGVPVYRKFYADINSRGYINLPEKIRSTIEVARQCGQEHKESPQLPDQLEPSSNWIKGCEVLAWGLDQSERVQAKTCLANIKAAILDGAADANGRYSRQDVFKNMYKKLNEAEQRFAAMVFTSAGESGVLAPPLEELMSIMKVLDNRARYANERGFSKANPLDAALQSYQFSFYNAERNAGNEAWRRLMIRANMREHPQISDAIDAYIAYQDGATYAPSRQADDVYHYYSTILDPPRARGSAPDWKVDRKEVDLRINERELDGITDRRGKRIRHRFYRNIAWSFRHNEFRSQAEVELDLEGRL